MATALFVELTLEEMLNDPIVGLTMARDGVHPQGVRALMARTFRICRPLLARGAEPEALAEVEAEFEGAPGGDPQILYSQKRQQL